MSHIPKVVRISAPKHGEIKYQCKLGNGNPCKNGAYFKVTIDEKESVSSKKEVYYCGMHSKKYSKDRKELKKYSAKEKKEKKADILEEMILNAAKKIISLRKNGIAEPLQHRFELVKMVGLFPFVPVRQGWINIYPNFKSGWQGIGGNYPELSPMSLGPVIHGQPGLPPSKSIENFHQGSKYWSKYETKEEFSDNQKNMFNSDEPKRHKFKVDKTRGSSGKVLGNIPDYFVWIDKDEKEHHLSYIESRQFYCNFYERLVKKTKQYKKVKKLIDLRASIQLCGPDAFEIEGLSNESGLIKSIEKCYLDSSHPFGHERVLFTMFLLKEENYPWRKYKTFDF